MVERSDLLYNVYKDNKNLCFCFDKNLKIVWTNKKMQELFPDIRQGFSVEECFPNYSFSYIRSDNAPEYCTKIRDNYNESFLEILFFDGLYVGVLHKITETTLTEHQGMDLLSYYIRQKTGRIFNLTEIVEEKLAKINEYESSKNIKDIEKICLSILKISSNLNAYYNITEEPNIYTKEINFHSFITPIMEQVKETLSSSNLDFTFEPDARNGSVNIDANLFAVAVLNIINTSYLYTKKSGSFVCSTRFTDDEMLLTLSDDVTDFDEVLNSDYNSSSVLDSTGEPPAMKKMCYDILKKTVELHGGSFCMTNNDPGIKILIRLKSEPNNEFTVSSPGNTTNRKLGIVNIMLSDVK